MITTVKIQGNNFLVNDTKSVPNDPRNTDYHAVQRWLEGRTDEWLALEEQFNNGEIYVLPEPITNTPDPEFTQAEIAQKVIDDFNAGLEAELRLDDINSIRDIREWVAAQPTASLRLKELEAEVVAKRETRK